MRAVRTNIAVAVLFIAVLLSAGAGSATYAYFSSTATTGGSITAADSFDNTGDGACQDENRNGQCDPGEQRITNSDLTDYTNESADLVIPENVGTIDNGNDDVSITANSITSEVDLTTKTGSVDLNAGSGGIDFENSNVRIRGGGGGINIDSGGDINLTGAELSTKTGHVSVSSNESVIIDNAVIDGRESSQPIEISGRRISARFAEITTKNSEKILSARNNGGGELDATGATIESRSKNGGLAGGPITLESQGTMRLNQSALRVKQTATIEAYLGTEDATLYAYDLTVRDDDDTLYYEPSNIEKRP